ncbi:MAG: hypothetical protein ABEJ95_06925 [Candidatus Nanohalobium sp.]
MPDLDDLVERTALDNAARHVLDAYEEGERERYERDADFFGADSPEELDLDLREYIERESNLGEGALFRNLDRVFEYVPFFKSSDNYRSEVLRVAGEIEEKLEIYEENGSFVFEFEPDDGPIK